MKTTVELPDDLLNDARRVATAERTSLKALLEEGLRWALSRRSKLGTFRLKDASVPGKGVQAGVREGDWEAARDLVYTGRGS